MISKEGRRLTTTIPGCRHWYRIRHPVGFIRGAGLKAALGRASRQKRCWKDLFEFNCTASCYSLGAGEEGLVVRVGMHTLASRCRLCHCRSFKRCQSAPVLKLEPSGASPMAFDGKGHGIVCVVPFQFRDERLFRMWLRDRT